MEKELEESVRKSSNHEIGINLISVISQVFEVDHNGRAQDITFTPKLQEVKVSACLNLNGIRIKKDDLLLIEKCLRNYRSIKHIYMSGCHLNCRNLNSISCHFGSVVKLDLSDNLLQEIRNDIFNCMPNVQTLDISMNKLSKLSADICKLKNLAELNLANNQLLYLPEEIGSLRKLMLLDVSHNLLDENTK